MAIQALNEVQRTFVGDVARPMVERLIAFRAELDLFIQDYDNQQAPVLNNADQLGDNAAGTAPRTDAPILTGANLASLRTFCGNMVTQLSDANRNAMIALAVRDLRTIVKS